MRGKTGPLGANGRKSSGVLLPQLAYSLRVPSLAGAIANFAKLRHSVTNPLQKLQRLGCKHQAKLGMDQAQLRQPQIHIALDHYACIQQAIQQFQN